MMEKAKQLKKESNKAMKEMEKSWKRYHAYRAKIGYDKKIKITYTNVKIGGVTHRKIKSMKVDITPIQKKKMDKLFADTQRLSRLSSKAYDKYEKYMKKIV